MISRLISGGTPCLMGIALMLGSISCKTQRLSEKDVVCYADAEAFLGANPKDGRDADQFDPFNGSQFNENYLLNGNDIIQLDTVPGVTTSIQEIDVYGDVLFKNPAKVLLPFSHEFFHGAKITIKSAAKSGGRLTDTLRLSGLSTWHAVRDYLASKHVLAKLFPTADFQLYRGVSLIACWNYNEHIWADLGTSVTTGEYINDSYKVSIDQSGLLNFPTLSNATMIEDDKGDTRDQRITNIKERSYLSQLCSMFNLESENGGLITLAELNSRASLFVNKQLVNTKNVNVYYPEDCALHFVPDGLNWIFRKKGQAASSVPYTGPIRMIAAVKKEYSEIYQRKLRHGANIYLTVYPASPGEPPFKINIKHDRQDLIIKPGDDIVLSF